MSFRVLPDPPEDWRYLQTYKHIFLINPAAGRGNKQASLAAMCREAAMKFQLDYEILVTEYPGHGIQLVRKAISQSGGRRVRIYACGGDGTLNEAAQGAFGAWNATITQFPIGTGNDFIKMFALQSVAFGFLDFLLKGQETKIDYMEASCGGAINVMSVGVDARVAAGVGKYKKLHLPGRIAPYALSAAEHVLRGLGESYQVEIDGVRYDGEYSLIFLGNGCFYGGGFRPVPSANPQDGLLDVLLVRKVSRLTAARVVTAYKRGLYQQYPQYITHVFAKQVFIRLKDGGQMGVNMDGEIAYTDRLEVQLKTGLSFLMASPIRQFATERDMDLQEQWIAKRIRKNQGKEENRELFQWIRNGFRFK